MKDALQHDGWEPPRHPRGVRRTLGPSVPESDDLFAAIAVSQPTAAIRGMVHGTDPIESQVAACRALPGRTALQQRILATVAQHGPLTAVEIEKMPEYRDVGLYNVRRRCSDLRKAVPPQLVRVGRRGTAALLDIAIATTQGHLTG